MSQGIRCASILVLAILAVTIPTRAGTVTDPERESGRAAFEEGRYQEALRHFRRSYQSDPRPELLCDIGEAAVGIAHYEEALSAFERCLEQWPEGPERVQLEERVEHLRIKVQKERDRPRPPKKREKMFELGGQALIAYFTSTNPDLTFGFGLQARFGAAIVKQVMAELSLTAIDAPKPSSEGGGVLGFFLRTGVRYYPFAAGHIVPFIGAGISPSLWYTTLRTSAGGIPASDTGFSIDAIGGAMHQLSDDMRVEAGLQCNYVFPNDVFYNEGVFWLALSVGASYYF